MFADPRRLSSAKYGSLLCLVRKIFMVALCYCDGYGGFAVCVMLMISTISVMSCGDKPGLI